MGATDGWGGNASVSIDGRKPDADLSNQGDFVQTLKILLEQVESGAIRLKYFRAVWQTPNAPRPKVPR